MTYFCTRIDEASERGSLGRVVLRRLASIVGNSVGIVAMSTVKRSHHFLFAGGPFCNEIHCPTAETARYRGTIRSLPRRKGHRASRLTLLFNRAAARLVPGFKVTLSCLATGLLRPRNIGLRYAFAIVTARGAPVGVSLFTVFRISTTYLDRGG
jgi:hypothetical protein